MPDSSASSPSYSQAYRDLRERVTELVAPLDAAAFDAPSPATPEWRVHDVVSHLVGVADDVVNGRLEGVASDAWTARQVDARRTMAADALLAEWEERSPVFEAALDAAPPEMMGQALFDAVTHEHDVRCALGAPGARDSDALAIAWEWFVGVRTLAGAPAMRFVTETGEVVAGVGEPGVSIEASRFELLRATVGRRSETQVASYRWDPEPRPRMLLADPNLFRFRAKPLHE
jgi:uncharacterized protein (TIGR03083 family)